MSLRGYKKKWGKVPYLGPTAERAAKFESRRKASMEAVEELEKLTSLRGLKKKLQKFDTKPKFTLPLNPRHPWAKKIKPRTRSRTKDEAAYRREGRRFLEEHCVCQWPGCWAASAEVHHTHGRRGRLLLHRPFWKAVCSAHHSKITNADAETVRFCRESGLLCELGRWNDQSLVPRP